MLADAEPSTTADVIVVLGAGLNESCGLNRSALARTIRGAELYHRGRAPKILITGGLPSNAPCAIADAMAGFALKLGVPDSALVIERASTSTFENGAFSAPLLQQMAARRLILVTDRLHMRRSEAIFRCLGFEVLRSGVPVHETEKDNISMLIGAARETAALTYYWWYDACERIRTGNRHLE